MEVLLAARRRQVRRRLLVFLVLITLMLGIEPASTHASGEVWRLLAEEGVAPAPRWGMAAVQDPQHQRLVMFGGRLANGILTDQVWVLDLTPLSESWTRLTLGSGPVPRQDHTMIYDARNRRAILFGGRGSTGLLNDVWVLDLASSRPRWAAFPPVVGPTPRSGHTAIYDATHQRMVVFGGQDATGQPLDEVWVLDLRAGQERWQLLTPPVIRAASGDQLPAPALYHHTAVYDPFHQQMIVFGGNGPVGLADDPVWLLSLQEGGEAWFPLFMSGGPKPRAGHQAVYDQQNRRMLIYGGRRAEGQQLGDVWALDLAGTQQQWVRLVPAGATLERSEAVMLYDPSDHRAIVFGGRRSANEIVGTTYAIELTLDGAPAIRFGHPQNGDLVNKTTIRVAVAIENFILDPYRAGRGPDRVDFGGWRLLLDGTPISAGGIFEGFEIEVTDLPVGDHVLKAELITVHGVPIGVEDIVEVDIRPGWPGIRIVTPQDGERTYAHSVAVTIEVENFSLSAGAPTPDQNRGHWHLALDGVWQPEHLYEPTSMLRDLPRGTHRIQVELRDENEESFDPPILDAAEVQVLEPAIRILEPPEQALINSSSVEVKIAVEDFILDPERVGGANEVGYGHWHLLLDGQYQAFVTGTAGLAATLTELTPGPHVITVELAHNDHTLLGVQDTAQITIAEGRPAIQFLAPENNAWVQGPLIEVQIAVESFILDEENIDRVPIPGHGHWHLFVDGVFQLQTAQPKAQAVLPAPGLHRITVTLSNNDHTSLDPPVVDTRVVFWPYHQFLPLILRPVQ